MRIVQLEPQRPHQMQLRAGIGAQADGVARVGRNLGADEDDVEHGQEKSVGASVQGRESDRARAELSPISPWRPAMPWPMRAAWIVPVPLRNARGRVSRPLTTRARRARDASTITLSAPAANRAWAAASAVLPVVITSSTNATCRPRTPCRETRQPGRRGARAGPAPPAVAFRAGAAARPAAAADPARSPGCGRSPWPGSCRADAARPGWPVRRPAPHRQAGCLPGDGRPSRRASTGASDRRSRVFN